MQNWCSGLLLYGGDDNYVLVAHASRDGFAHPRMSLPSALGCRPSGVLPHFARPVGALLLSSTAPIAGVQIGASFLSMASLSWILMDAPGALNCRATVSMATLVRGACFAGWLRPSAHVASVHSGRLAHWACCVLSPNFANTWRTLLGIASPQGRAGHDGNCAWNSALPHLADGPVSGIFGSDDALRAVTDAAAVMICGLTTSLSV